MSIRARGRVWAGLVLLFFFLVVPALLSAQADPQALAAQNLRGYRHVFIAYAVAWLLVMGWLISVARRLARIERNQER